MKKIVKKCINCEQDISVKPSVFLFSLSKRVLCSSCGAESIFERSVLEKQLVITGTIALVFLSFKEILIEGYLELIILSYIISVDYLFLRLGLIKVTLVKN